MTKTLKVHAVRTVENANAIILRDATLNGYGPVSGMFQVWDADLCVSNDGSGHLTATVMCRLGDCEDDDQELKLQFTGPVIETVVGWDGEVIDSLMLE
jgi:hypothetical protein